MAKDRDLRLYLFDILESIRLIREYTHGMTADEFENDRFTQDAVERRLAIIAEAAKKIPPDLRASNSMIPWRSVQAMRNMIIHEYFGVQRVFVWRTVTKDLDALEVVVKQMIADLEPPTA